MLAHRNLVVRLQTLVVGLCDTWPYLSYAATSEFGWSIMTAFISVFMLENRAMQNNKAQRHEIIFC